MNELKRPGPVPLATLRRHRGCLLTLFLVAALGLGCDSGSEKPAVPQLQTGVRPAASNAAVARVPAIPSAPQSGLPVLKLWLGSQELKTEIASNPQQWATGMMHRTTMPDDEAMLFVFPRAMRASFWMKNTLLALSCAYIDASGTILEIHDMKPLDETPIVAASEDIQYVLETTQGWFARHQVPTNTIVRTERGSFAQTFFGAPR